MLHLPSSLAILILSTWVLFLGCNTGKGVDDTRTPQGQAQSAAGAKAGKPEDEIEYTRELVMNKAREVFPKEDVAKIMGILDQYGVKPYEQERERVQLAALKVSDGKVEKLKEQIAVAKEDYRDVLVLAEYPGWFRSVTGGNAPLKPKDDPEEKKIMEQDRKQYLEWIKGKP